MAKTKEPDRLAKDVAAALASGMSYGRWKALQKRVEIKKKEEIPEGWLVCKNCGKPFKPKSKRPQLYCEASCQVEAERVRNRERRNKYSKEWRAKKKEGKTE